MTDARLTIDWISATSRNKNLEMEYTAHPALHDWENWEITNGRLGYNIGAKHVSGAMLYENMDRPDMGKHIIYSGKTLQRINKMYDINSSEILKHHIDNGDTVARIDIALDFYGDEVSVLTFQNEFMSGNAVTKLRSASSVQSLTSAGHTFYIGSTKKRKKLVRIYDKSAEMGWDFSCTRVEIQLMGKPATKAGIDIAHSIDVGSVMLGCMTDVIDFITIPAWNKTMWNSASVKIGTEYTETGNTMKWLEETVALCLAKEAVLDSKWWIQYKLMVDEMAIQLKNK